MTLLALDFDGVLCDSARETGISGWKAAGTLWEDMAQPLPPQRLLDGFLRTRPVVETGYESILMMRLLKDGEDPEDLLETFPGRVQEFVARSGMDAAALKRLHGEIRDRWIEHDPRQWLELNPLYPGAAELLTRLSPAIDCYIVTTKQRRFVRQLLAHNGVPFAADRILGLDRGMTKEEDLRALMEQHPGRPVHLVEDRLLTLKRFLAQPDLAAVRLHIACWGYNTETERREADQLDIHRLRALALTDILNTE